MSKTIDLILCILLLIISVIALILGIRAHGEVGISIAMGFYLSAAFLMVLSLYELKRFLKRPEQTEEEEELEEEPDQGY